MSPLARSSTAVFARFDINPPGALWSIRRLETPALAAAVKTDWEGLAPGAA